MFYPTLLSCWRPSGTKRFPSMASDATRFTTCSLVAATFQRPYLRFPPDSFFPMRPLAAVFPHSPFQRPPSQRYAVRVRSFVAHVLSHHAFSFPLLHAHFHHPGKLNS